MNRRPYIGLCGLILLLACSAQAAELEQSSKVDAVTNKLGQASQKKVSKLSNETDDLLKQYQAILQQADYQKAYNQELGYRLAEQKDEMASLEKQLQEVQITRLHVLPLLRDMLANLREFILLDLPFEQEPRLASVEKLEELLSKGSVSITEKFRRVMEVYQTENDYSYNIGQYRGMLNVDDTALTVEFLRVGRSELYYQTLDGKKSGYWNGLTKKWQALDSAYNQEIRNGIRVAAKQLPPQLLKLPMMVKGL